MRHDTARRASHLIEHILTRFHECHRRELPALLVMAGALEARGLAGGVGDDLRALGDALERHMFKEEMRLFPMMEQGGNTLIGQLIADLHLEHVEHDDAMARLQARLAGLTAVHGADPGLDSLRHAVDKLSDDLAQHIHAEDDELFPLFLRPEPARSMPVQSATPQPPAR